MSAAHLERFQGILSARRDYRETIRGITSRHKYVVFYGCGRIFSSIVSTWNETVARPIDFCCDSDPQKWGRFFNGCRCLSPAELAAIKHECAVFVTVGDFREVYDALLAEGFPSVNLLYKYDLVAGSLLARASDQDTARKLAEAYALLADQDSRDTFDAIVNRVAGVGAEVGVMARVCRADQYFPADLIRFAPDEAFVDVGAYDGDTVRAFVNRTSGRFGRIFSFELSRSNFARLESSIAALPGRDRITAFNVGAWHEEGEVAYSDELSQSSIGAGEARARVLPLDRALQGERVTYVKMDIEGAEPEALRGAEGIITAQKPKLAICVYHDIRHLWEIPLFLQAKVPEYKIYLRHHTNLEYETVCYAIP